MTTSEVINLAAILIGPIAAVLISMWLQDRSAKRERKLSVFRSLMKTRRRRVDPEHVSALNLVEIEFFSDKKALELLGSLMEVFNRPSPADNDPSHEAFWRKFGEDHDARLTLLLDRLAKSLGYSYQQIEIMRGGYGPVAFMQLEEETNKARRLFADAYDGKRGIPIDVIDYRLPEQLQAAAAATQKKLQASE